jgi:hypothetical protein
MKKFLFWMLLMVLAVTVGCTAADKSTQKSRAALDAQQAGDMEKYKKLVKEAHDLNPEDVFTINNVGTVYEMEGNIVEAKAHFKECMEKAGDLEIGKSAAKEWAGKPLKDLCAANLKRVEGR